MQKGANTVLIIEVETPHGDVLTLGVAPDTDPEAPFIGRDLDEGGLIKVTAPWDCYINAKEDGVS